MVCDFSFGIDIAAPFDDNDDKDFDDVININAPPPLKAAVVEDDEAFPLVFALWCSSPIVGVDPCSNALPEKEEKEEEEEDDMSYVFANL